MLILFPKHTTQPPPPTHTRYAFVEYETTAEAAAAMAALDGTSFKGRRLQVRFVREQEAMPTDPRAFLAKGKGGARTAAAGADGSPSSFGGSGVAGRRGKESEESALDAKIRALKAMLQQK